MSTLFLKRFLSRPWQVASITPSSKGMIRRVTSKMDFSEPRVIVEYGPGEGCHTREIVSRMHRDSTLLLLELDPELAGHLRRQFRHNARIHIVNVGADQIMAELAKLGFTHCDYIVSGIPFSTMEKNMKRDLLQKTYDALSEKPTSAFIIYQFTNELRAHAKHFPHAETEYFLPNIPPNFITVFYRLPRPATHGHNGNGKNGHKKSKDKGREHATAGNGSHH